MTNRTKLLSGHSTSLSYFHVATEEAARQTSDGTKLTNNIYVK